LFARLTLFVAAWIATTEQPAFDISENDYRFDPYSPVHGPSLPPPLLRLQSLGSTRHRRSGSDAEPPEPVSGRGQPGVPQQVAVKSVRAGRVAGWVTGIATGAGLGAAVAGMAARLGRRRAGKGPHAGGAAAGSHRASGTGDTPSWDISDCPRRDGSQQHLA